MSKILIVVERFYPEDFLVNDLAAEWKRRGHDVEVLTQVPSYPFDKIYDGYENKRLQTTMETLPAPAEGGAPPVVLPVHRINTIFGYNAGVARKILNYLHFGWRTFWWAFCRGRRFDRVFIYHTAALTMATAALPMRLLWRKPVTIWTQDLWPDAVYAFGFKPTWWKRFLLNSFVRMIYGCCARIVVSCRGYVRRIRELTGRTAEFIPQWEADPMEIPDKPLGEKLIFLFAGNLGIPQNLENQIEGFRRAGLEGVELHFVGGGAMLDRIKKKVAADGIANVVFDGHRPHSEMPAWYAKADALIISLIPDYRLTLPGKFQSYLKANRPLIGLLYGDVREMMKEYKLGVVADPDDCDAIAEAFRKMTSEIRSGKGGGYGARAKAVSESLFCREKLISALLS